MLDLGLQPLEYCQEFPVGIMDLEIVLRYIARNPIQLLPKSRRISKRVLRELNELLIIKDDLEDIKEFSRIQFLLEVLDNLEAFGMRRGSSILYLTTKGKEFLQAPLNRKLVMVFDCWREKTWGNLDLIELVYTYELDFYPNHSLGGIMQNYKKAVLTLLSGVEDKKWYALSEFARLIQERMNLAIISARLPKYKYAVSEEVLYHFVIDTIVALIQGPLKWLNIVVVKSNEHPTSDREDAVVFQLSSIGKGLLRGGDFAVNGGIEKENFMSIAPNCECYVNMEDLMPLEFYCLSTFLRIVKLDCMCVFTLRKESVWDFLEYYGTWEDLEMYLRRYAKTEVPQNIIYNIKEWAMKYGEIQFQTETRVKINREDLASALLGMQQFAISVDKQIKPNQFIIKGEVFNKLIKVLKEKGYSLLFSPLKDKLRTPYFSTFVLGEVIPKIDFFAPAATPKSNIVLGEAIDEEESFEDPIFDEPIERLSLDSLPSEALEIKELIDRLRECTECPDAGKCGTLEEYIQSAEETLFRQKGGELVRKFKIQSSKKQKLKVGRNDSCPCGSGKKYKYCCGKKAGTPLKAFL